MMIQSGTETASKADRPLAGLGFDSSVIRQDLHLNVLVVIGQKKVDGSTRTPRQSFTTALVQTNLTTD